MADKKNEGFHSAAGLIRYFDNESDKAYQISPFQLITFSVAVSVFIIGMNNGWWNWVWDLILEPIWGFLRGLF